MQAAGAGSRPAILHPSNVQDRSLLGRKEGVKLQAREAVGRRQLEVPGKAPCHWWAAGNVPSSHWSTF